MHVQTTLTTLLLTTLPLLTSAHFILNYPPARGFDEDILGEFPCGGQSQSQNRTAVSLTHFPVALEMGHDRTVIQMLLGFGNNPGSAFNYVLVKTFAEEGLGDFCVPHVVVPASLGITEGMNATLQVVTDGDTSGGLYNCADITFTSAATDALPSSCNNGTGVSATLLPANEASLNANESTATGGPASGGSATTSSASGTAAAPSSTSTGQAVMLTATWGMVGAAAVGALALM